MGPLYDKRAGLTSLCARLRETGNCTARQAQYFTDEKWFVAKWYMRVVFVLYMIPTSHV